MYIGQRVKDLLKERGLGATELLAHLGVKENGTIARFTGSDIKASRLEQIADFFGVSIDYFFERIDGDLNLNEQGALATKGGHAEYNAGGKSAKTRELAEKVRHLEAEIKSLNTVISDKERLIAEKDERIKLYEKLLTSLDQ